MSGADPVNIECTSRIEADHGEQLQATPEVKEWLSSLPDGAMLAAHLIDKGSQRDPEPTLHALSASWAETRR